MASVSDSVGLDAGLRISMSNEFPAEAYAVVLEALL